MDRDEVYCYKLATEYNIPCGKGTKINLFKVIPALVTTLLSTNRPGKRPYGAEATVEEERREKIRKLKIANDKAERIVVDRYEMRENLASFVSSVRDLGEKLEKHYGEEVGDLFAEVLQSWRDQIDTTFSDKALDGLDGPGEADDDAGGAVLGS